MAFEGLLGNHQLKENLTKSLQKGHISHFYLISGPTGSGKRTLARLLAAAINCRDGQRPCLRCNVCRKILADTHPDFITVDDPEKKTVPVDLIRKAREDIYIQPNEADRKIYLFPRAQDMGIPGQNALLKVLEEPPAYGVFLLLTDNPEKLLPTIRSRCTQLKLVGLEPNVLKPELARRFPQASASDLEGAAARSGGYLGQAISLLEGGTTAPQTESFVEYFASRNTLGLFQTLVPMERWKRDQLIPVLEEWVRVLEDALVCRSGLTPLGDHARTLSTNRSGQDLLRALEILQKCIEYAQGNVSVAAICGHLEWALR